MLYYKKYIKAKKIIQYWFFLGGISGLYKVNYRFLRFTYARNCFIDYNFLLISISKLLPLFFSLFKQESILFVTTYLFYTKVVVSNFLTKVMFTRSSMSLNHVFNKLNPRVIIFLDSASINSLIIESKHKKIPSIGLTTSTNSTLIEYPVFVNTAYFYTVYFFTKFFIKLVSILKKK